MLPKFFIVPILVMALISVFATQPAYAEPVTATVTIICAAVFATAVMVDEALETETGNEKATTPGKTNSKDPENHGSTKS